MNKTAIKNFAVWARKKLIDDITYKAGMLGITESGIATPLPQSTKDLQFFDIGTKDYAEVSGNEIKQREALVKAINQKEKSTKTYKEAFEYIVEEVAYTWFNRLIAIRFMEVNDYLPSGVRVLSSENSAKSEPDFVTNPFEADLELTPDEQDKVMQLKDEKKDDELFRLLFIKQCNKLHDVLPELFEQTDDYTELLLTISFTDDEGIVSHLINDIDESDFDVQKEGQVEIIGWLYQFYNIEPKNDVFSKSGKISKNDIPAATQLFTPDWVVRYMVENSLGRLWIERNLAQDDHDIGHWEDNNKLKSEWKYYLDEAEQKTDVQNKLNEIRKTYKDIKPEDIKIIDPCMGSGHILVYAFDVLMQIYESYGYMQREAAKSILINNIHGLDIDTRAYQLAYFAVMMKARQYNRRILNENIRPNLFAIQESNEISKELIDFIADDNNDIKSDLITLCDELKDATEYGSIINVSMVNFDALFARMEEIKNNFYGDIFGQGYQREIAEFVLPLIKQAQAMAQRYDVVVTNPPYMSVSAGSPKLNDYVKFNYPDSKTDMFAVFIERCNQMTKKNCYYSLITMHSWMFLSSYETLRGKILSYNFINMAHLGARAFEEIAGEVVQTVAWVQRKSNETNYIVSFKRLIDFNSQQSKEQEFLNREGHLYKTTTKEFEKIPGTPFAYWVNPKIFEAFKNGSNITKYIDSFQGIITGDNNKFLRYWHEVNINKLALNYSNIDDVDLSQKYWIPYNKGGEFRKWYGNQDYVVYWKNGPDDKTRGKKSFQNYYLKEYVSWSYIAMGTLACRYFPSGFLWDVAGSGIFDKTNYLYYLQAFISSKVGIEILNIINPTINYQVENILQLPILESSDKAVVDNIVKENIKKAKNDWDSFEISWEFRKHPLVPTAREKKEQMDSQFAETRMEAFSKLSWHYKTWEQECEYRFNQLKENEEELNRIFIDIYGLQDELTPDVEDKDVTVRKADLTRDIKSLISYAVGCMFGRYSIYQEGITYAGGEWNYNEFENMAWRAEGKQDVMSHYSKTHFLPDEDNCLLITDEEYDSENDIVNLFVEFIETVYGSKYLNENLDFIAQALGNKGNTSREVIRNYFLNDFIKDHIKLYQKRPIYWLYDSGKQNGFKALVYMHRYNADTTGNMRVEYLHRMQKIYERELERMQDTIDNSNDNREISVASKRKEKLQKQLKETKDYDAKVAHLALSRIGIDLDDGVKVNYEKVQTASDGTKMQILYKI